MFFHWLRSLDLYLASPSVESCMQATV